MMHLASVSNQIQCYDWPSCNMVKSYAPHPESKSKIRSATWANTAGWMCVVTSEGRVEVVSFRESTSKFLHQIEEVEEANYAIFQSLNKRDLAIAKDDTIMIYDMKRSFVKKELGPTPDHSDYTKLMFDSRDAYLCASAKNNQIYVYDSKGPTTTFQASNTGTLTNFTINDKSGLKIAACTNCGSCILWELGGITNIYSEPSKCVIKDLVYRDNSLLYVTDSGQCIIRDYYNTSTISKMNLHYRPKCIDMCLDSVGFAICAEDGTIYAYDVRNLCLPINMMRQQDGDKIVQVAFCKHVYNVSQRCSHTPSVPPKVTKPSKPSKPDNTKQEDEIRVVHEYDSLAETNTNASESSIAPAPFNMMNFKYENMPILCEVQEATAVVGAITHYSHFEDATNSSDNETRFQLNQEVVELVRSAVKEEMEQVTKELRRQVQKAVHDATKSNFYELRMSLVKEFVKVQDILDRLQINKNTASKDSGENCKVNTM